MSNPDQDRIPFSNSIEGYRKKRYKGHFQRIVNDREQTILEALLRKHSNDNSKRILDLPCGYGRFTPLFKSLNFDVRAVDISPTMVDHVKQLPIMQEGDSAFTADIREGIPLDADSINAVACIRLFQHLHYPEWRQQALREFARVCNGPIIVSFYDRNCVHFWTKHLLGALKRKPVRVQMISRQTFETDVAAAGLEVVEYQAKMPGIHAQTFAVLGRKADAQ